MTGIRRLLNYIPRFIKVENSYILRTKNGNVYRLRGKYGLTLGFHKGTRVAVKFKGIRGILYVPVAVI